MSNKEQELKKKIMKRINKIKCDLPIKRCGECKNVIYGAIEEGIQTQKQEFQKDLNLARQCITMQLFKCKSKSCKNFSCVLNENKELKGEIK